MQGSVAPDEINRRVLTSHLDESDLQAAERLNEMNLRYYERVVRPVLDEWVREVRARRRGQTWAFVSSCAAIIAGCVVHGMAAYVLFFVGCFGFCTAIAAWFGSTAVMVGPVVKAKTSAATAALRLKSSLAVEPVGGGTSRRTRMS